MRLNSDEKILIDELRNLSKVNSSDVNDLMKALMLSVLMNFAEGQPTKIPYFGELKINYLGDKISDKGRIADIKVDFIPSPALVKNIGQLVDVNNPNCDTKITDVDCIQDVMKGIADKLTVIMNENS